MMTKTVDFYFDFASPNAYLSHQVVPGIEERTGTKFNYIPVLLGGIFKATNNKPPMEAFFGILNKNEYQSVEMKRFQERHGIDKFKMNPHFPVMSLQIIRGAVGAQQDGYLDKYIDEVLKHMWEEPKKMDDPEVIKEAFTESGFDADRLMNQMQDPEIKAQLIENTEKAVKRGTFGIPTFFVGDDIYFGKDTLWQVEEALAK
ncbi:MAG TPA: 2-hydroxychromene-2-carboxylate isomerase [Gammaproteobacteria bacterium]|jgi:2-hydroxychromene-2-carboxylate isomerase|nr:2-hydroxychromene-2-carboxylate isomerase [Gammaproteobacteria bacterium]HIN73499.1 2-hydroxychromene-2-carboxylate isomerase [Gammaproteobacteria bacterium]HIO42878.1 2-hydroxychromene-2-carboxylate isomerase [Gammaproteobacteria bacterium]